VNVFLWAGTALVALELPLLVYASLARRVDGVVALAAGSSIWALALVLLAQGFHRTAYTVLGLAAALIGFVGAIVFVRFLERELDP
jgi:multisubunit Na+/H+ antiporter MnhF subunit